MVDGSSKFFHSKKKNKKKRVLTIAATFPSLIQPWLVNQLVQIKQNGGENRILARRSKMDVYASNIDKYGFLKIYKIIEESNKDLLLSTIRSLVNPKFLISTLRGITRYHRVFFSKKFTFSEKIYSIFLTPYMGLKNIDLIHSHSEMAGNKLLPITVALNKPFIFTFHGLPPVGVNPITSKQRQRYIEQASVIFVNTEFAKKQYVTLGGDPQKIRVVPQGISLDEFPFKIRPYPKDGEINLLTVGRYHLDKGQQYSIHAVAGLVKKGVKIKYRLVGSGPEIGNLRAVAKKLGVSANVQFFSSLSDEALREIYDSSHMFILPSLKSHDGFHEETQGVVLQEAQASGLITIATKTGGIPECIDDGVSGFLVVDRSADAIEEKLLEIIGSPEKWEAYQVAGRKWVENRYDIEYIGKILDSVYEEMLVVKGGVSILASKKLK